MADKNTVSTSIADTRRGRPRSTEVESAILEATRSILEESGSAGVTIGEVVARAGVSTATIYRRWQSVGELILEAIRGMLPDPVEIDSGSLAGDMSDFLSHISAALTGMQGFYSADLNDRHKVEPVMRREIVECFVLPRQRLLAAILARAQARGELGSLPPIETCWDYVVGPVHHRLLIRGEPFDPRSQRQAETVLIAGLRALGGN